MSPWLTLRLGRLPLAVRLGRRVPAVLGALLASSFAALVLSIGYGTYHVGPADVLRTVLGLETGNADHELVVLQFRLPRALTAYLVGSALAVAGAILQGLTRNALAAPDIVGVTSGGGLAAVALTLLVPGVPAALIPPAALAGGALAALLIYLLAWRDGDSPARLVLIGIGLAAMLSALTTLLLTFGNLWLVGGALIWLTGSTHGRTWEHVHALWPWLALLLPLALVLAPQLNALALGDQLARGLGVRVILQRGLLLFAAVALASAAVATAGVVGFVGLMAPHMARRLVGPAHEGLLLTAAPLGGVLVVLADLLGRALVPPIEIPCGVITAVIGAPYFLYLLGRSRRGSGGGVR